VTRAALMGQADELPTVAGKLAYTVAETCRIMSIGRTHLYDLIRSGDLPVVKLGGRTLIARDDLEALISRRRQRAA
jgi:excisionase family DNA binding protein